MRIELPREAERLGSILFFSRQKTYLLDSGMDDDSEFLHPFFTIQRVSYEQLHTIEKKMAIVIPMKDERLPLLEGILTAIPYSCLPIIVSNSQRDPIDKFRMEVIAIDDYCRFAKRNCVIVHQKDEGVSNALKLSGYSELLGPDGLVKDGKAEGMILGIIFSHMAKKDFVGFIDSDNYFPGSVFEYVRIFTASMALSKSPYSMTRIIWNSKPKIRDAKLYFAKWGRVSRITNDFLNRLISSYTGIETNVIRTGNAGEHAISLPLALKMNFSTGFSIETNHFIDLLEKFGDLIPGNPNSDVLKKFVEVYQVESRNPHLHEMKEEDHVTDMIIQSLSSIYHSPVCTEELRAEITRELISHDVQVGKNGPPQPVIYKPLEEIDFEKFQDAINIERYSHFS
jgi:mannosyl-3-phosphoglycerate synthase